MKKFGEGEEVEEGYIRARAQEDDEVELVRKLEPREEVALLGKVVYARKSLVEVPGDV